MSQDSAEDGYFLAALDSFVTRTCYANAGGEVIIAFCHMLKPELCGNCAVLCPAFYDSGLPFCRCMTSGCMHS